MHYTIKGFALKKITEYIKLVQLTKRYKRLQYALSWNNLQRKKKIAEYIEWVQLTKK